MSFNLRIPKVRKGGGERVYKSVISQTPHLCQQECIVRSPDIFFQLLSESGIDQYDRKLVRLEHTR